MSGPTRRVFIQCAAAPAASGPFNHAVLVDKTLYVSGQVGVDPKTSELVPGGVREQARQALVNIGSILSAAGATHRNVVKATVLLTDMNDFQSVNEVYREFFHCPHEPARACYAVAALPRGAAVEIESVAVVGELVDEKM